MNTAIPITQVILKDGRSAVIRASMTTIKHCKRHNLALEVVIDGAQRKEEIPARQIESVLLRSPQ